MKSTPATSWIIASVVVVLLRLLARPENLAANRQPADLFCTRGSSMASNIDDRRTHLTCHRNKIQFPASKANLRIETISHFDRIWSVKVKQSQRP